MRASGVRSAACSAHGGTERNTKRETPHSWLGQDRLTDWESESYKWLLAKTFGIIKITLIYIIFLEIIIQENVK